MKVDEEALKVLVAKSVIDGLTPEDKTALISKAVTDMLTAPSMGKDRWGNDKPGRSPLQTAFDNAVDAEANRYARRALEEDPVFQAGVKQLFTDVAAKLFDQSDSGRNDLIEAIADSIRAGLKAQAGRY